MKIITQIDIPSPQKTIDFSNKILCIGSCFADTIGEKLKIHGFDCLVNPFGTLYNIYSIFNSLVRLGDATPFTEDDVFLRPDGKFVTWSHHSRCGLKEAEGFTAADFLKKANTELKQAAAFWAQADTVLITLGTSYIFKLKGTESVVSNCHKFPAKNFERVFVPEVFTSEKILSLAAMFPEKRLIFTVSPIRHLADGAHGNNLSKSSLLLAIDNAICKINKTQAAISSNSSKTQPYSLVEYFPSYEIMMDELRDYRWYAEDMTHPSEAAVKYIFERFTESFIAKECHTQMQQKLKLWKAARHNNHGYSS